MNKSHRLQRSYQCDADGEVRAANQSARRWQCQHTNHWNSAFVLSAVQQCTTFTRNLFAGNDMRGDRKLQFSKVGNAPRNSVAVAVALLVLSACGGSDSSSDPLATNLVLTDAAARCQALQGKAIEASLIGAPTMGAVVTSAAYKTAKADAPNAGGTATIPGTPDHCQILVDIKPVDPSAPLIKSQVNLPVTWNRRSLQFGGAGTNGVLVTGLDRPQGAGPELPLPLARGFVTLGTDSGHQNASLPHPWAFALNNEALVNFAHASHKKTHDVGVQLSQSFYGEKPAKAYYIGSSQGGREGMAMAQRYPADFDGIVSIDPVIRIVGLWQFQRSIGAVQSAPGTWLGGKVQLVHDTVQAACDGLDGIEDRVVSNYSACKPLADSAVQAKRCPSGVDEGAACFSDGQLATLRWFYSGITFPFALANAINSYPGFLYGGEGVADLYGTPQAPGALAVWNVGTTQPTSNSNAAGGSMNYRTGGNFVRYLIMRDPNADPLIFDPLAHQARIQELSNLMDMTNPDLSAFQARGGKLILRENLADKGNSPQSGFDYYSAAVAKLGKSVVDQFFVAFGATGLPHIATGLYPGAANTPSYGIPGQVDFLGMIDDWVTKGAAPSNAPQLTLRTQLAPYPLISSKPMCRYGSYPRYLGATPEGGNLASNYVCTAF